MGILYKLSLVRGDNSMCFGWLVKGFVSPQTLQTHVNTELEKSRLYSSVYTMDYWEQLTFLKRQIHLGLKRWPWIHQPCRQKKHVFCAQAVNWKKKKKKNKKAIRRLKTLVVWIVWYLWFWVLSANHCVIIPQLSSTYKVIMAFITRVTELEDWE